MLAQYAVLLGTMLAAPEAVSDDSVQLYRLQNTPAVSPADSSREQYLEKQLVDLKDALKREDLKDARRKALKNNLKRVKREYKAMVSLNRATAKKHVASINKLSKKLSEQYGMGPYPFETWQFVSDKPLYLQPFYRSLFLEGERNATLNFNRLGLAAMELGFYDHAEWAFDRSLDRIEGIYFNNVAAQNAKSKFNSEDVKEYKGEPYERAMAYYYRGLLFLRAGDFENARAVFRAGEYQDTFSENEEFQSDFAALNYLIGWSMQCQGRSDLDAYRRAQNIRKDLSLPGRDHNTLFVAETGKGPRKYGGGEYGEVLKFKPDSPYENLSAMYQVEEQSGSFKKIPTVNATRLTRQAKTRGSRAVDDILLHKVEFKKTTDTIGEIVSMAGAVTALTGLFSDDTETVLVGAGVALVGEVLDGVSLSAKPEADLRAWDNLPEGISLASENIKFRPDLQISAVFSSEEGSGTAEVPSPVMYGGTKRCAIVWSRSQSALNVTESSPGARYTWKQVRKQKKNVQQKDIVFRQWLVSDAPRSSMRAELR
ncbi:MAG: hypothetical protein AB3N28_09555 [Kordiimonas sp.]